MRSATRYLADTVPAWFSIDEVNSEALIGRARVPKTPWAADGLHLRIFGNSKPRAGENVPGTDLPSRCPERHIQGDRTFCLGLRYIAVRSAEDAVRWWEQLQQYLRCQGVAERTGVWPPAQALDHGDAGEHHERALALAKEAGIEEEYAAARLGDPSWLTDPRLHLCDKHGKPINGRALCPRGCRRRARGHLVPVLRADCSKRTLLIDLVRSEQRRREALKEYWQSMFNSGTRCCRTMRSCPLGNYEDSGKAGGAKTS